jgi:hypothetical protein
LFLHGRRIESVFVTTLNHSHKIADLCKAVKTRLLLGLKAGVSAAGDIG